LITHHHQLAGLIGGHQQQGAQRAQQRRQALGVDAAERGGVGGRWSFAQGEEPGLQVVVVVAIVVVFVVVIAQRVDNKNEVSSTAGPARGPPPRGPSQNRPARST
jgi:hypothetical protein